MSSHEQSSTDALAINAMLMAVRQAADVLCDRWTLSLLLLAFSGVNRSGEFRARTGMASRPLTQRLKTLEQQEIVVRMPYSRRPLRYGTHLTTMGEALFGVFACMTAWEQQFGEGQGHSSVRIHHQACVNTSASPGLACAHCDGQVSAHNVGTLKTLQGELKQLPSKATTYRRTTKSNAQDTDTGPLANCIAILGDKWTIEI